MRRRLTIALLGVLVLSGCGLPLPDGVRSAGDVGVAQPESVGLQLLPPGPQPGATAVELVNGFLTAQVSPQDDYAIARQFLTPSNAWKSTGLVRLYVAGSQRVVARSDVPGGLTVGFTEVATIKKGGAYSLSGGASVEEPYVVARDPASGQLRLSTVPDGVRLADTARDRSYVARDVYYLGRPDNGAGTRLVADRVFQQRSRDPARALVEALLSGPTTALAPAGDTGDRAGAVQTAVPPSTRALDIRTDAGIVTVNLSREVLALSTQERQQLAAQLVWTLVPTFRGVRLLADGKRFAVPGAKQVQDRQDWPGYDPSGLGPNVPLLYLADRRLRSLDGELTSSEVTQGGPVDVDAAAVSPGRGALAVLTDRPKLQPDVVRIGPLGGALKQAFSRPGLTSPTWGSGERGLWVLQQGLAPIVWLVPGPAQLPESTPQAVLYEAPRQAGLLSAITVSRDGARIAMIFGSTEAERRLYVGRIQPSQRGLQVALLTPIAPHLSNVTDVAWESGTSLAVLAQRDGRPSVLAFSVAVDGSEVTPINTTGLPTTGLESVAAAPDESLVVGVQSTDGRAQLYREGNGQFVQQDADGRKPFYPG